MMTVSVAGLLAACHCASAEDGPSFGSSTSEASTTSAGSGSSSGEETTGEPFDASRWIGRYHYENVFLPFGEHGDPHGPYKLLNFEILVDGRAVLVHDDCTFEEPNVIAYEWEPDEEGWLRLRPGADETSLRFEAAADLESLRVQLTEPCRELKFEIEGRLENFLPFLPGESCWVDRCTTPNAMQVDYCPGEEPEEACP